MNNSYFKRQEAKIHNLRYTPGSNPPKEKLVLSKRPINPMPPTKLGKSGLSYVPNLVKKFKAGIHYVWVRYGGRKKSSPAKFYRLSVCLAKASAICVPKHHTVVRAVRVVANKFGNFIPT